MVRKLRFGIKINMGSPSSFQIIWVFQKFYSKGGKPRLGDKFVKKAKAYKFSEVPIAKLHRLMITYRLDPRKSVNNYEKNVKFLKKIFQTDTYNFSPLIDFQ